MEIFEKLEAALAREVRNDEKACMVKNEGYHLCFVQIIWG